MATRLNDSEIVEFSPEHIEAHSQREARMYVSELAGNEPMASVLKNNPEIYFVAPATGANWGKWDYKVGSYYDTTTAAKHDYWHDKALPQPTKDIHQLRIDMRRWGYCKVADAVNAEQVNLIRKRVLEQAEGEAMAGIRQKTPSGQNINCCVNKGRCFELLIEQHPAVMQGGPLIEQLLTEAMGADWICTSLIASISLQGGVPQALHQDQNNALDSTHPMSVNVLIMVTDVDEKNGGTLVIPGSHQILADAVRSGSEVGKLPPAINIDAPAGTAVLTDGRLLHGTGINHTDTPRIVMLNGMQKPWLRQQENWMLSVKPEVLSRASPKLLQRMGYQASTATQTNEGHGFGARGRVAEPAGALVDFRLAADRGEYHRVGELGPQSSSQQLNAAYTLREVVAKARAGGKSAPVGIKSLGIPQ